MARMLWKDRVGEEKTVNGVTFKFVDYVDGKIIMVDSLNHNTYVASKDVWKRGVFKDAMNDLCSTTKQEKKSKTTKAPRVSKYVGQEKTINDVVFYVISYAKNKVEVGAKGYKGSKPMCTSTWTNGKFYKNIMKVLERIYEMIVYNDFQKDFIGRLTNDTMSRIEREFNRAMTISDVRKLYKHYARYTHPDLGFTTTANITCFEWLTALRDFTIAMIEYWLEDDED